MNLNHTLSAFVMFSIFACLAQADGPERQLVPIAELQEAGKDQPKQTDKDKKTPQDKDKKAPQDKDKKTPEKNLAEQPKTDIFDQALLPRGETSSAFNPHMMGDFVGTFVRQNYTVLGSQTTTSTTVSRDQIASTTLVNSGKNGGSTVIATVTPNGFTSGQKVTISGSPVASVNGTWRITVISPTQFTLNNFTNAGSTVVLKGGTVTSTNTTSTTKLVAQTRSILIPAGSSTGAFKIADNESPRPQDRVFITYNYFGALQGGSGGSNEASVSGQTTGIGNPAAFGTTTATATSTIFPAAPRVTANLNREVFGFEKTFFDGNASFEMRVPLLQQQTNLDGFNSSDVGDLTIIGKYAFINDRNTGNVLSGGLAITVPTGPRIESIDGTLHSTLLQPWFGYIWNTDKFFLQAFHSIVAPTNAHDITLLFNDVGLNYWLYRGDPNRFLSSIVPMAEVHVTTPLNHRDSTSAVYVPDIVVLTGGVHFGIFRNTTLSLGVATPITGPRVYNVEGFVQLNWRF